MVAVALYAQVIFFLAVIALFLLSRGASVFHPLTFYLAFHGIVFVIRPLLVHYAGFENAWLYMGFRPTEDQFVFTLIVTSAALLVFAVVSIAFGGEAAAGGLPSYPAFSKEDANAFAIVTAAILPVALYSAVASLAMFQFDAGPNQFVETDLNSGVAHFTNGSGYAYEAQSSIGAVVVAFFWLCGLRWWSILPILVFMLWRAYFGIARWPMIIMGLVIMLLSAFCGGKKWPYMRHLLAAVPLLLVFHLVGQDRSWLRTLMGEEVQQESPVAKPDFLQTLDGPDFANFDYLAYVLAAVPDKTQTFTYFTQYLQLLTEPIPRALWSSKPLGAPVVLVNFLQFGNFIGLTTSLPGDGWMSFGWVGLVATMGLVAFILARLHRWFCRHRSDPFTVLIYCLFLPLTIQWFRDGGISIAKFTLFTVGPVILWRALARYLTSLKNRWRARVRSVSSPPPT
jgi:hypothetical protein